MRQYLCKRAAALLLAVSAVSAFGQMNTVLHSQSTPKFIKDSGATVLEVSKAPGGMTVYIVSKGGSPAVFYASPDGTVAFVGVMFDAKTGRNLSDAFVERGQKLLEANGGAARPAAMKESATGAGDLPVMAHMKSQAVPGIIEGTLSPTTTYVFFDPRCHYCHNLFTATRDLAKRGASIKWIPVNTLGDQGLTLSAQVLQRGISGLDALANGTLKSGPDVSLNDRVTIEGNTTLLRAIVQEVKMQPATPTIVFQDKNGKLSVLQDDGSNKVALAAAFGRGAK